MRTMDEKTLAELREVVTLGLPIKAAVVGSLLSELEAARVEVAELREAATLAASWLYDPDENATERFERIADEFHRMTGMLRPGKSQPLEGGHSDEERQAVWDTWSKARARAVLVGLRSALARAKGGK